MLNFFCLLWSTLLAYQYYSIGTPEAMAGIAREVPPGKEGFRARRFGILKG